MTHLSPAVFGMWSVCSVLLTGFCFYHIWHYDRCKCLLMNHGPYSGAFKRLMTYTYILSLPLITIYSVGNAVIKYQEGFVYDAEFGVRPKPYTQWTQAHQDAIFPLYMFFSIGFSFEMTTHLEELCFWLFLMNAAASSQEWFRSKYFLIWSCGSVIALIYVPAVTIAFRHSPLETEAYTFLAGSLGGLALTLFFVPILYSFPGFLRNLVQQGADKATIIRLNKFHELNRLRIFFRLLFVVPLVTVGIDGVKSHTHPINESMFWTDVFGMVSAFGCLVSSAITLIIFFPRSDENEFDSSSLGRLYDLEVVQRKGRRHHREETVDYHSERDRPGLASEVSIGTSSAPHHSNNLLSFTSKCEVDGRYGEPPRDQSPSVRNSELGHGGDRASVILTSLPSPTSCTSLRPNRLYPNGDIELGNVQDLPTAGGWVGNWTSQFKSPLDVMERRAY